MERQAVVFKRYVEGRVKLPSKEQMLEEYNEKVKRQGSQKNYYRPNPIVTLEVIRDLYSLVSECEQYNEHFYNCLIEYCMKCREDVENVNFMTFKH